MQNEIMKIEYETTNTPIEELCDKYGVSKSSLSWYREEEPSQDISPLNQDISDILMDSLSFKKQALKYALYLIDNREDEELGVREVKDLTNMVTQIETSIRPDKEDTPVQVNVLVQNLMEAKDDC